MTERGVSEAAGVAVLILATVLVTASVGLSVLFFQEEESGVEAEFTYDFSSSTSSMLVEHAGGDEIPAGELVVSGPAGNVTWAALAGANTSRLIGPGDKAQLSEASAYGGPVSATDVIKIVRRANGTATILKSCQASCSDG